MTNSARDGGLWYSSKRADARRGEDDPPVGQFRRVDVVERPVGEPLRACRRRPARGRCGRSCRRPMAIAA